MRPDLRGLKPTSRAWAIHSDNQKLLERRAGFNVYTTSLHRFSVQQPQQTTLGSLRRPATTASVPCTYNSATEPNMATPSATTMVSPPRPYRRFLNSAFHTRFVHAALICLLISLNNAFWLGSKRGTSSCPAFRRPLMSRSLLVMVSTRSCRPQGLAFLYVEPFRLYAAGGHSQSRPADNNLCFRCVKNKRIEQYDFPDGVLVCGFSLVVHRSLHLVVA